MRTLALLILLILPLIAPAQTGDGGKAVSRPLTELPASATSGNGGLFVGVGEFPADSGLTKLNYTVNDAIALCHVFVEELKLVPANQATLAITPVPNPEPPMLTTLRSRGVRIIGASRNDILREVRRVALFPQAPEDLVVVSISTHGFEKDGTAYVMPTDGDAVLFTETGIPMRTLETVLRGNPASTKHILIVDACRERPEGESRGNPVMTGGFREALKGVKGTAILASCDVGQLSWEARDFGHGVYTHFLLEGLRGKAADNKQPYLRLGDVASYATRQTENWVSRQRGQKQVPWTAGETAREIPLAINPEGMEAARKAKEEAARLAEEARKAEAARIERERVAAAERDRLARETEAQRLRDETAAKNALIARKKQGYAKLVAAVGNLDNKEIPVAVLEQTKVLLGETYGPRQEELLVALEGLQDSAPNRHYFYTVQWPRIAPTPTATPQPTPRQTPVATVVDPFSAPAPAARPTMPTTSNPKPGDRREVDLGGGVKMGLVWVPPGSFQMGSNDGKSDEKPVRTVTLTRGFWMGEGEVTVGAWKRFVAETSYRSTAEVEGSGWADLDGDGSWSEEKGANWKNAGFPQTDSHPVVLVSWNDTVKFNEWLSRKAGGTASLPTEAQWEYACRAGTSSKYFWGDNGENHAAHANIGDQSAKKKFSSWSTSSANDGYLYTAPVGSFRKNGFGLYDMHGNVWEWCVDWYGTYPAGPVDDPTGPSSGSLRVIRGGSWNLEAQGRGRVDPAGRNNIIGFRPVLLVQ